MQNHIIALSLAPLGLVAPSCDPLPPSSGDGDTGTSTGHDDSTSESADTTTDTTTDPMRTSVDDTGGEPMCGNGIVEAGELCDDAGASATCDADCTDVECGDMEVNAVSGEECDGIDLAGSTCQGLGLGLGVLSCDECSLVTSGCPPVQPVLALSFSQVKQFDFSWTATMGAEYYQLLESPAPGDPFVQLGGDIAGESVSVEMALHLRFQASYVLRACNDGGCTYSTPVDVVGALEDSVGYGKASNTGASDRFGYSMALSGDGSTLVVGAWAEDSASTGIDGKQLDDTAGNAGAVYVFVRDGMGVWSQEAYVKASNTGASDWFGVGVALSENGSTLAVGASNQDVSVTGTDGNHPDDSVSNAGAVYVFVRSGMGVWSQEAYVKASNAGMNDGFGESVTLSGDGNTLAVGAWGEDSKASGIGGDQTDDSSSNSGAVYVFGRDGMGVWSQEAYVKASNTGAGDSFGHGLALSGDGNTLAVGAYLEGSAATGIGGDPIDDSAGESGAVYVFVRSMGVWSQQAYIKASNTGVSDWFSVRMALSGDGNTLAVGAPREGSNATGIGGDQANEAAGEAGAVYVFVRSMGAWSQEAYVKASNTGAGDWFGARMALSGDGNTLAVGAYYEDSSSTGIGSDQADDSASDSGAVYVFVRSGMGVWSQQAYVKASNTGASDSFGESVALSNDGRTLAVGARHEDSNSTGIGGDQADDSASDSGAVYLF